MCGIAGELSNTPGDTTDVLCARARAMGDQLAHRGPDDRGEWVDAAAGVMLSHRRLSIIDLTTHGHQPMTSASGRIVIAFNGEVYNHRELRADLLAGGHRFHGHSDTEVLLEACERWGIAATARRLVGMFAFAVWDRADRSLTLVRDRLGIKPLYIAEVAGSTLFASETSAFQHHPSFKAEVDRGVLRAYLRRNCVPFPHSIYHGVRQVRPGSLLVLRAGRPPQEEVFWSMEDVVRRGHEERLGDASDAEILALAERGLEEAVRYRMLADVPVGAFLSGGIDSSLVVALMQAQTTEKVRTFSIGSTDARYDESRHARRVAEHLGTEHIELVVRPEEVLDLVPRLAGSTDEPFADSSYIPTRLVSQLAREHVTVALSGDGGDELFAGYTRHRLAGSKAAKLLSLPTGLRRRSGRAALAVSPERWDAFVRHTPGLRRVPRAGEQIHKAARVASVSDLDGLYDELTSHWRPGDGVMAGAGHEASSWVSPSAWIADPVERMMFRDTTGYLRDDILTKVDRASMAVSLEVRVPLLDHRVVEMAWRFPRRARLRNGQTKWVLRELLAKHVPTSLTDRPKRGFGVPLGEWLRGPLREWAESLLDPGRLVDDGIFEVETVRGAWQEHLTGSVDWQHHLWDILSFQAWLDRHPELT